MILAPAAILLLALLAAPVPLRAVPPQLDIPYGQLQHAPPIPNFLLNLSLTYDDAGAAYRQDYAAGTEYQGYFNPHLCYGYPLVTPPGAPQQPDLAERSGYFSPRGPADVRHECGAGAFSGNLMNWATMSTLDLLRYGLTGGDRIIDSAGLTVLQRAWLPDGALHADFYANAQHFPRKAVAGAAALTPFGAASLYVVSCRNRVLFSSTQTGASCDAPRFGAGGERLVSDKFFGEFNVAVSVCDAADSASRPELCRAYGRVFKPEGSMQAAAGRLRIGIMSYLTESGAADPALYGGALRVALGDIRGETDALSGMAATAGAIDMVNRMGRSNPARLGAYKAGDPGAELYYEALRYLQARTPSVAVAGTADDRLPLVARRADPVLAACQRNIIATIGHPVFSGDRQLPGNTRQLQGDSARAVDTFAPASFDVMAATRRVGELEADPARTLGNAAPRPDLRNLDTQDDGAGSYYLAGAAYWAHVNPIRRDKPVRVDSFSLELGRAARPASSALYLAAKYGAFDDLNADANPFLASREWSADGITPTHFHSAAEAAAVPGAVRALFAGAGPLLPRAAGPTAAWRGSGGAFVIQTSAGPPGVQRHTLNIGANGSATMATASSWDAGELLEGRAGQRKIYTLAGQSTLPFVWPSLPPELRAMLDAQGQGAARLDYLRGDRQRELGQPGGLFRQRASLLGDVVHSVPLVVGAPSASATGEGHDAFREQAGGRRLAVYVGANDGMLHAFDAASGAELFAYIPRALMPALALLSDPAYQPRPYADGSAGHGDALLAGRWRTVLAAGMGMGARGVYALDITDPAAFGQGLGALWEFTEQDDPAIGFVHAPPQIIKLDVGSGARAPQYRYFALVSSAINSLAPDGNGALFLLALDKPPSQRWQLGVNYYRIATSGASGAQANALSAPGVVTAGDGSALYAYAGDLQGQLWRFDLGARRAHRIFSARDAAGRAQPISQAPRAVFAPGGGYLVIVGTGKLLEQADLLPASFTPQSIYAILDRLQVPADPVASRAQLAARTLAGGDSYTTAGERLDYFAPGAKRGWYIDFPDAASAGERSTGSLTAVGGAIVVDTLLPGADACAAPAGRTYVLDAVSGLALADDGTLRPDATTGTRRPAMALMSTLLIDTGLLASSRDAAGTATVTRSLVQIQSVAAGAAAGSAAVSAPVQVKVRFPAMRLGWREVANWQELHDAAR